MLRLFTVSPLLLVLLSLAFTTGCTSNKQKRKDPPQGSLTTNSPRASRAEEAAQLAKQGDQALVSKNWRGAVQLYKRSLKANPKPWGVHMNLAIAQAKVPDFNAAIVSVRNAMNNGGEREPRFWYNLGTLYQDRGMYEEAIDAYRAGLSLHQKPHLDSLLNIGSCYLLVQRAKESRETYEHVVQLAPDDPRGHLGVATVSLLERKYDAALKGFDEVIRLKPGYAQAHFNRGVALYRKKRCGDAVSSFRQFIQLAPKSPYTKRANNYIKQCTKS